MRVTSQQRSRVVPALGVAVVAIVGLGLAGCAGGSDGGADGDQTTITLATWRTEDTTLWETEVIPVFEAEHPDIKVVYQPTDTNDYNATIQASVDGGTAADLIMCRPFDVNRAWIADGYFDDLSGLDAVGTFSDTALAAWTDDAGTPYCVPTASVLAGFYYNKAIFEELGLEIPTTMEEFYGVLDAVKENGTYAPIALGSADGWQLAYNVLYSLGPNYWKGEDGRLGLIDGTQKLTDPDFVDAFQATADLIPYLPEGYQSLSYEDMMQLFTLGQAAILPDGSWDITAATSTGLDVGVFAAPVVNEGDQRYQQEMPDMAIGLSASSKNKEAAAEFLEWLGTPEFQQLYVNKLPGFFSMGTEPVTYDNKLAQEFADLKIDALLTPRLALDRLSAGQPPLDDDIWAVLQTMFNDGVTAEEATTTLQTNLDSWYVPAE
ncbi:ABC transporter substrate-binding protein [Microbacterium aoyamense]|uniref:Probable sugar-binding periplasmic protein n=1 Tax=Microbacterium aoyamense TaxID=344166 RepID=A0ABN2PNA6_9MICO|nr:extracellular solute-binding protein [Microbacterium aoyamense]